MIDEPTTARLNMSLGVTGSVMNLRLSNIQDIDRGPRRGSWFQRIASPARSWRAIRLSSSES
jgi:hypothetical protein